MRDQYSEYHNLPKLLKRFSFDAKMSIATIYSSDAILFKKRIEEDPQNSGVFPWCLETFVMLAMESTEYSDNTFAGKEVKKFRKMYNAIWDATSDVFKTPCGRFTKVDTFLAVTGLNQFFIQESPWIRQYRYWRVFNDDSAPLHLKSVFKEKMKVEYEDFLLLGQVLQVLFVAVKQQKGYLIPPRILKYLIYERFPVAAHCLTVTRGEYVQLQKHFVAESSDPYKYIYSLRPSYQFAFVEEAGFVYFPLPHLLNQNVTSSLLYRLTDNDDQLRTSIGKHIWEKYLLNIICETDAYEEVFPEQEYRYRGSISYSPDILARQSTEVLFIDSKSTVPNIGIRLLDAESYERNINIVADNIKKLYNQIHRFQFYSPFKGDSSKSKDDYWGIVVVLEDSYIRRKLFFEKAKELLSIEENSDDWNWLIRHIRVVSLYEIERICLYGHSLIDACRSTSENNHFDYSFSGFPTGSSTFLDPKYLAFRQERNQKVVDVIEDMEKKGIIPC